MEINDLTIKVVLLLLPGIFGVYVKSKLTEKEILSNRDYIISIIIMSFISYFMVFIVKNIILFLELGYSNFKVTNLSILNYFINSGSEYNVELNFKEVLITIVFSIYIGIVISNLNNNGFFYNIFRWLGITNGTGKDVWSEIFDNNLRGNSDFIYVVDNKNNRVYGGQLKNYSIDSNSPELYLCNVVVYSNELPRVHLYDIDKIYIKLDPSNMLIEFKERKEKKCIKK